MKKYAEYFMYDEIKSYLCQIRANISKQRNKKHLIHVLTSNEKYNYHIQEKTQIEKDLEPIMPSRKKWKRLGYSRYKNNRRLNSIKYNCKSLRKTISFYEQNNPQEPFLVNLKAFIQDIKKKLMIIDTVLQSQKYIHV